MDCKTCRGKGYYLKDKASYFPCPCGLKPGSQRKGPNEAQTGTVTVRKPVTGVKRPLALPRLF